MLQGNKRFCASSVISFEESVIFLYSSTTTANIDSEILSYFVPV